MNYLKSYFFIFFACSFFIEAIMSESFSNLWKDMQEDYNKLSEIEQRDTLFQEKFCHPFWQKTRSDIKGLIKGKPQEDFLKFSAIAGTMVRSGFNNFQKYEIDFLTFGLSEKNRKILFSHNYDTDFGNLQKLPPFDVSANTLGHLFYIGKILEGCDISKIKTIVEFGGGYGNLARLIKQIIPQSTLILFDLPETLAIQALFLRYTLKNVRIFVHNKIPNLFKEGAIHLLPVFFVEDLNVDTNLFISTFALSESTEFLQKVMLNKRFYNADYCYIVGQVNGWGPSKFVNHCTIISGMRDIFEDISCIPFHHGLIEAVGSYEILGKKNIKT